MEFAKIGTEQIILLTSQTILMILLPLVIATAWTIRKKEKFSTVIIGAVTFLLFALVLEKPIQNLLLFPDAMGLTQHAASRFINAHPVLLAFMAGLFPGLFEETGRLIAFKTVLKNRKNKETAVSYGIGHGCFEVMLIVGATSVTYLVYAFMINSGTFGTVVSQVMSKVPEKVDALYKLAEQLAAFSIANLGMSVAERVFAVMFHIGASIIVFYACRNKNKLWLYPLAILLHTVMDFIAAMAVFKVFTLSDIALEGIIGATAVLTFCGAYFLLYRKDGNFAI